MRFIVPEIFNAMSTQLVGILHANRSPKSSLSDVARTLTRKRFLEKSLCTAFSTSEFNVKTGIISRIQRLGPRLKIDRSAGKPAICGVDKMDVLALLEIKNQTRHERAISDVQSVYQPPSLKFLFQQFTNACQLFVTDIKH